MKYIFAALMTVACSSVLAADLSEKTFCSLLHSPGSGIELICDGENMRTSTVVRNADEYEYTQIGAEVVKAGLKLTSCVSKSVSYSVCYFAR